MVAKHLVPVISDRGFARLPAIPSDYGGDVRVYESSSASHPAIWLSVEGKPELQQEYETVQVPMHLSIENALKLADQIKLLVANHYQGTVHRAEARLRRGAPGGQEDNTQTA